MSDLISRKDLYDDMAMKRLELHEKWVSWDEFCRGFSFAMEFVKQAPSAEPEWEKGKWIKKQYDDSFRCCSICGYIDASELTKRYYNFCPSCGADMRGE